MLMKKTITILWIAITSFSIGNGQEYMQEKPGIFVNGEGKLYINKQLPVYLWLSTSPEENAQAYLLTSDSSKKYSNPMYFDTEGRNTVRSPWCVDTVTKQMVYPPADIIFDVYADGQPPVTRAKITGKSQFEKAGITYYSDKVEIVLTATDVVSGVSYSFCSLNGKTFEKYSNPLAVEAEGNYVLTFYSVDQVGNKEAQQERKFALDKSAPVTTFTIDGLMNKNYISPKASIVFKSSDDLSGVKTIYYRINQGPEYPYTAPVSASRLADGKSSISFYAVDNLSNREKVQTIGGSIPAGTSVNSSTPEKTAFEFYVDKMPPSVIHTMEGDQQKGNYMYISPRTRIILSGTDDKSGVDQIHYGIDATALTAVYKGPFTLETSGLHTIRYNAVDFVGNHSLPVPFRVYADTKPPHSSISIMGLKYTKHDTVFIGKNVSFSIQATDGESGLGKLLYAIDDDEYGDYSKSIVVDREGFHRIRYYASDMVNNQEDMKKLEFYVDLTPPEIHYHYSIIAIGTKKVRDEEYTIYPPNTLIYLAATDRNSGGEVVQYSINAGPVKTEIPIEGLLPGNYKIKILAYDVLKNKSEKEIGFAIE